MYTFIYSFIHSYINTYPTGTIIKKQLMNEKCLSREFRVHL